MLFRSVPYRGGGPLAVDLIAGQVQMSFASLPSVLQFIRAGRLRAIAVPTAKRSRALPEVPTFTEAGIAGFEASNWQGIYLPAKTPAAIVTRLNDELRTSLATAEVDRQLAQNGFDPVGSTPAELAAMMRTEQAKWAKVVKDSGARAE